MYIRIVQFLFCFTISACSHLIFQPNDIEYIDIEKNDVLYDDIYFTTQDNLKLHGWFLPSRKSYIHGTIMYLHGNAQNISAHINNVFWLPYSGFNVFLFDYQGYGKSEGEASLSALQHDFHFALDWLIKNKSIDNDKIIIYGQSLGAAVSLFALSESKYKNSVRGIIVESSFISYRAITQDFLARSWLTWIFQWPLSFTVSDNYRPIDAISKITPTPVLIIHSKQDEVIPYSHGEELYLAARDPKYFWVVDNAKHIQSLYHDKNREIFVRYLLSLLNNTFPTIVEKN